MPWAKVDDGWWCHPKVMGLTLEARGLWVSALSWSCAQRRDVVPDRLLAMLGAPASIADELVHAGLWVADEAGWRIHDWAEYQERSLSEKRAEAGRKGGLAKAAASKEVANAGKADLPEVANGLAGPSHPIPSLPNPSSLCTSEAVDNVLAAIVEMRMKEATKAGTVKHPTAYRRTLAADVETLRPEAEQAIARYDEPTHRIAEFVEGRNDGRFLTRRAVAS